MYARKVELLTNIMFIKHGVRSDLNVQTNTCRLITSTCICFCRNNHTWCTMMLIIYTSERCVNHCHTPNFDGSKTLRTLTWTWSLQIYPPDSQSRSRISTVYDQHADLPFCPTRNKPSGKRKGKLLATLYDKQLRHPLSKLAAMYSSSCNKDLSSVTICSMASRVYWTNTQFRSRTKNGYRKIYIN